MALIIIQNIILHMYNGLKIWIGWLTTIYVTIRSVQKKFQNLYTKVLNMKSINL